MAAFLLLLTVVASFTLLDTANIPVQSNFDSQRMNGRWHPFAIATQEQSRSEKVREIEGLDTVVKAMDNGDLELIRHITMADVCAEVHVFLHHTEKPGVFTTSSGTKVHIMATDYDSYCIMRMEKPLYTAIYLTARRSKVTEEIRQKFKSVVTNQGYTEETISKIERTEQCIL